MKIIKHVDFYVSSSEEEETIAITPFETSFSWSGGKNLRFQWFF